MVDRPGHVGTTADHRGQRTHRWDSAQYAAAVGHYDVTHGEPQPPGYWLYVVSGRLLHQVTGLGTIHSLVVVAAVASAAAAGLTVVAGPRPRG